MAETHSETENEKVLDKLDEINRETVVDVAAGESPVGQKAIDPKAVSGNVWAEEPKKQGEQRGK